MSKNERHPLIADRVLHVPNHYANHETFIFPGWQDNQLFGNAHPLCIEYCAGNGSWIAQKAQCFPNINWIAVEKRYDRVRKIWSKIKNYHLSNLIAVCAEAWTFTHYYLENKSVRNVYINFPDPWPKRKHTKHRLMQPCFLDELARILQERQIVTFVSDDVNYIQTVTQAIKGHPYFQSYSLLLNHPDYGTSWFEQLWRQKGKTIYYLQFFGYEIKTSDE